MPRLNETTPDADLDRRLGKARDLLDGHRHRSRYGAVSLLALVAAGVSATLLSTLVLGADQTPAQAQTKAKAAPPAFELSSSDLAVDVPAKPAQPLLVGTER